MHSALTPMLNWIELDPVRTSSCTKHKTILCIDGGLLCEKVPANYTLSIVPRDDTIVLSST